MNPRAKSFWKALVDGKVCLHPTDSLPGLTFDPTNGAAAANLEAIKGQKIGSGLIGLVCNLEQAKRFWQPLPFVWEERLAKLWPAPLSVIWRAAPSAPACLLSRDGMLGLRAPALAPEANWYSEVLATATWPLPSTSVNLKGEPPIRDWTAAAQFVRSYEFGYADTGLGAPSVGLPSTLIVVSADGSHRILREGAVKATDLGWEN